MLLRHDERLLRVTSHTRDATVFHEVAETLHSLACTSLSAHGAVTPRTRDVAAAPDVAWNIALEEVPESGDSDGDDADAASEHNSNATGQLTCVIDVWLRCTGCCECVSFFTSMFFATM